MGGMSSKVHELLGGEAYAWIEQDSSIMLKVVTSRGDPVEMQWADARELAQLLIRLADEGEASDQKSLPNS
jgi:hypothetical protein